MNRFILLLLSLMLSYAGFGQNSDGDFSKKASYRLSITGGQATIKRYGVDSGPNYSTAEFTFGAMLKKPIVPLFELHAGLWLGTKIKRESYFFGPYNNYTYYSQLNRRMNMAVSDKNRYFLAIPVLIEFDSPRFAFDFKFGGMFRQWSAKNENVDYLSFFTEVGLIGSISRPIFKNLSVAGYFYQGITSLATQPKSVNRFLQVGVEYGL